MRRSPASTSGSREVSKAYGLPLDPKREVWRLSVGERQRIEIVRCLLQDPKLLILDEPTSVLTPQEAEQLFLTLRVLRKEGRAILYIIHKLEEVSALCDTATILRGGKVVATCDPREETAQSLASMMVGGEVGAVRSDGSEEGRAVRGSSCAISTSRRTTRMACKLDGITFEVAAGEILGIAGVAGNGQDELFAALSGEVLADSADAIRIDDTDAGRLSHHRAPPARRGLRAGGAARPRDRAALHALRERAAHRPRGEPDGAARLHRSRAGARLRRPHHQGLRCAQGKARPGGGQPLGRQPAEVRGRPRNPARAARAGRQPADLGRRCRRGGRDPPGAHRSRGARRRRAGDEPGPRRALRDFRPHGRDLRRAAVGAAPDAPRRPRRDRHADGGRRHEGEGRAHAARA